MIDNMGEDMGEDTKKLINKIKENNDELEEMLDSAEKRAKEEKMDIAKVLNRIADALEERNAMLKDVDRVVMHIKELEIQTEDSKADFLKVEEKNNELEKKIEDLGDLNQLAERAEDIKVIVEDQAENTEINSDKK